MSSLRFYTDLEGFHDFQEALLDTRYQPVPEDWWIVITDVIGSTKAIEEGRYKEVNTIGASTLAALRNVMPDIHFPFVFGGDGASAIIPGEYKDKTCRELSGLSALSENSFGMKLRVGLVSVKEINAENEPVTVAKYMLAGGFPLATFRGGALRKAEEKVKGSPERYNVHPDSSVNVDLKKLSCRWKPLVSRHGVILSLLLSDAKDRNSLYTEFLTELRRIAGSAIDELNPVRTALLRYRSFFELLPADRKMQNGFWSRLPRYVDSFLASILFGWKVFTIIPLLKNYVGKTAAHSDYRKFDDMLRMVIDCTTEQAREIENLCSRFRKENGIAYGIHQTDSALMTCYVSQFSDGDHVHFIDGGNGGYAMAAKQLKAQIKEDSQ